MVLQVPSSPLLKGIPRRQESARATTTTRKQSMPASCPAGCITLQSVQLCPSMETSLGLFILSPIFTKLLGQHIFDTATFLPILVAFKPTNVKGIRQKEASLHTSNPSYDFLRGSPQEVWSQLLALLFILRRLLIWICKVLSDPEKEDAVKALSTFISLFLFNTEHTWTCGTAKAHFLSTNLRFPVPHAELHPTVTSSGMWLGQLWLFPLRGTDILWARLQTGGWGHPGYSWHTLQVSHCFKRTQPTNKAHYSS